MALLGRHFTHHYVYIYDVNIDHRRLTTSLTILVSLNIGSFNAMRESDVPLFQSPSSFFFIGELLSGTLPY